MAALISDLFQVASLQCASRLGISMTDRVFL